MTAAKMLESWVLLPLPTELADGRRLEGVSPTVVELAPENLVPPL
jgi:hypothetical protein